MNKAKNLALATTLALGGIFSGKAQTNDLAMANVPASSRASINSNLTQPDVRAHKGDGKAMQASFDGNIAIHTFHSKHDPISGFRYARGLANGFASRDKTGNNPIYITSTHQDNLDIPNTYSYVYINGITWKFEGNDVLSPKFIGQYAPLIMADYVKAHGKDKLIPINQEPNLIASYE